MYLSVGLLIGFYNYNHYHALKQFLEIDMLWNSNSQVEYTILWFL